MSTIGYGDMANPESTMERIMACLAMCAGSIFWAYLIGNVCSMVATLNKKELAFKSKMDDLNDFMKELNLPAALRKRMREFFRQRRKLVAENVNQELLGSMSLSLHGEVANAVTRPFFRHVPWLCNAKTKFLTHLSLSLKPGLYAPGEFVTAENFHLITKGVVIKDNKILISGDIWGFDMILTDPKLKMLLPARTLTHVFILALSKVHTHWSESNSMRLLRCIRRVSANPLQCVISRVG